MSSTRESADDNEARHQQFLRNEAAKKAATTKPSKKKVKREDSRPECDVKRDELWNLIHDFAKAEVDDSWKGGGDPNDESLIEAELEVATLRLQRYIDKLFPAEE